MTSKTEIFKNMAVGLAVLASLIAVAFGLAWLIVNVPNFGIVLLIVLGAGFALLWATAIGMMIREILAILKL